MKELLLNLFKYTNPILNTVLGFKSTGSRLCMWLWTLNNDSAYSSLFVNQTSHYSHAHVISVCFWQPMWEVVCLWAVPQCNLWMCTPTTPVLKGGCQSLVKRHQFWKVVYKLSGRIGGWLQLGVPQWAASVHYWK